MYYGVVQTLPRRLQAGHFVYCNLPPLAGCRVVVTLTRFPQSQSTGSSIRFSKSRASSPGPMPAALHVASIVAAGSRVPAARRQTIES
jgi:hypothetical protein